MGCVLGHRRIRRCLVVQTRQHFVEKLLVLDSVEEPGGLLEVGVAEMAGVFPMREVGCYHGVCGPMG